MTIRTPSRSIFRPSKAPSQDILHENRRLIQDINRRGVLRGALSPAPIASGPPADPRKNGAAGP